MSEKCNHEGSVCWHPFRKAVMCRRCGLVFFELEVRTTGPVLVPVSGDNLVVRVLHEHMVYLKPEALQAEFDLADQGVLRESALAAFRAVRARGEPTPAELDTFKKVARAVHEHLWRTFTGRIQSNPHKPA